MEAKVRPIWDWTPTWLKSSHRFSMGSSTVLMFRSPFASRLSAAYRVVVFPDPVGPVTSRSPWGRARNPSRAARSSPATPRSESPFSCTRGSKMRSTTFSPKATGRDETRNSTDLPA